MNIERLNALLKRLADAQDRGDDKAAAKIKAEINSGRPRKVQG